MQGAGFNPVMRGGRDAVAMVYRWSGSQFKEGPMSPFDECLHFSGLSFVHTVND